MKTKENEIMEKNRQSKLSMLKELSEETFRREIIIPILKKIGYKKVSERHGSLEIGKDITFYYSNGFIDYYGAVVAKIGDISGSAQGKHNLATVSTQVHQAINNKFDDSQTKESHSIEQVIVWATGNISAQAQIQIVNQGNSTFRNVHFKDGNQTLDLIEEHYPSYFTIKDPYINEYFNSCIEYHNRIEELRTLGTSGNKKFLNQIFVEPKFSQSQKEAESLLNKKITQGKEYTLNDIINSNKNIVILGEQGIGKTTTLRKILIEIINRNKANQTRVPIPVFLCANKVECTINLVTSIINEFLIFNLNDYIVDLTNDLTNGDLVVLIDGFDEITDEEKLINLSSIINQFASTYPQVKLIITCRKMKAKLLSNLSFKYDLLEQSEFKQQQISKFVRNWFEHNEKRALKLIDNLTESMVLKGLSSTPLVLSLIAIVFEEGDRDIPSNLTDLYSQYIEICLGRWDKSKDVHLGFEWTLKRFILKKLCWDLHNEGKRYFSHEEIIQKIYNIAKNHGLSCEINNLFDEIVNRSELIIETDTNNYQFKNISIQDYFTGAEISESEETVKFIRENFLNSEWERSIFFACGLRPDYENIAKAIFDDIELCDGNDYLYYAMHAGACLQATYLVSNETKEKLLLKIINSFVNSWILFTDSSDEKSQNDKGAITLLQNHFYGIFFFSLIAKYSLSSSTFAVSMKNIKSSIQRIDEMHDDKDKAIAEFKNYFISIGCCGCELYDDYIEILEKFYIERPDLLIMSLMFIQKILKRKWLEDIDRDKIASLKKRISKKLQGNYKYLQNLENKPLLPLYKEILE